MLGSARVPVNKWRENGITRIETTIFSDLQNMSSSLYTIINHQVDNGGHQ
jgi:hypothetical protein